MATSRRGNRITVGTTIDRPPAVVWEAVEDVGTHTEWMADAVAIRFVTDQTAGVGTAFDCDTEVGPFRLTDRMEITRWEPGAAMGVRHVGLVTGEGVFTIADAGTGRSRFTWTERLVFPWWMGGSVGGVVGGWIMRRLWQGNLRRLKTLVEAP